jgi:hypothetical protein
MNPPIIPAKGLAMSFSDRVLNFAFRFAKVVSTFLAGLLALAFVGSLGYSLWQWKISDGSAMPDFDTAYNESVQGNRGVDVRASGDTAAENALDLDIRNRFGSKLNTAMSAAGCSAEQFDSAIKVLAHISGNDESAHHLDDVVAGAVKWFEASQAMGGDVNIEWACGHRGYWADALDSIGERTVSDAAARVDLMKGLGLAGLTLIAAFLLMVIPAVYRIEESVRRS